MHHLPLTVVCEYPSVINIEVTISNNPVKVSLVLSIIDPELSCIPMFLTCLKLHLYSLKSIAEIGLHLVSPVSGDIFMYILYSIHSIKSCFQEPLMWHELEHHRKYITKLMSHRNSVFVWITLLSFETRGKLFSSDSDLGSTLMQNYIDLRYVFCEFCKWSYFMYP